MSDHSPPNHVIEEWRKHCDCCPYCSDHPCDGVSAGGMCDSVECDCMKEPPFCASCGGTCECEDYQEDQ